MHGDRDDGNPADSAGIPRVWKAGMRSSRGNGSQCCGDPAGMEKIARDSRGFNLLTSSERCFSVAGRTLDDSRNLLSQDSADGILFYMD